MTNNKRVFCKDCEWYSLGKHKIRHYNIFRESHDCLKELTYDCVTGEVKEAMSCYDKNANCDCADFEVKDE